MTAISPPHLPVVHCHHWTRQSTRAPPLHHQLLIFQLGSKQLGKNNSNLLIPNNAPEVPNDGAASIPKSSDCANNCAVFNAPEVPNDGAATVPKSSDCANDCAVPHIQAAGDEEVMIVPSSGSFKCPFQYNPVDREWQQETCEAMALLLMELHRSWSGTPNHLHTHCWGW